MNSAPPERRFPAEQIPAIARELVADYFPTGDRAAMKRMALGGPAPLAFHRFVIRHIDSPWQSEQFLPHWRALLCALALQPGNGFDPRRPFGQALAEAGFAEARLERLLGARGETLAALLLRAARMLAAKRIPADWRQAARLLFAANDEAAESARLIIARAFYRTASATEKEDN